MLFFFIDFGINNSSSLNFDRQLALSFINTLAIGAIYNIWTTSLNCLRNIKRNSWHTGNGESDFVIKYAILVIRVCV